MGVVMAAERRGNLVPIGRFSQICRLTIKALRHYDELGLLKPALVDPQSGYRYYSFGQVAAAGLIRTLRAAEMPLEEIGAVLRAADPGIVRAHLARHRDHLQARIAAQRAAVALLDDLLTREERTMTYTIDLVELPMGHTAGRRLTIPPADLSAAIPRVIGETMGALGARGIAAAGPPFVVYHEGMPDSEAMTIEVGWPVGAPVAGDGDLQPGTLGGCLVARTTHVGPYDQLPTAWAALGEWIQARGHESAGAPWESYPTDPQEEPDPATYRTEISWPVR
jgi:DNA-binding transcriptional MerR regulator